jgi:hypothetical protein
VLLLPDPASCSFPNGPRSRHRSSKPNLKKSGGRCEVQLLRGLPVITNESDAE